MATLQCVDSAAKGVTPQDNFYNIIKQSQFTYRITRLNKRNHTGTYLQQRNSPPSVTELYLHGAPTMNATLFVEKKCAKETVQL